MLASLYPATDNVNEFYKYFFYEHTLNTSNLSFPLAVKDIPKFENLNRFISVNVLSLDGKYFCIKYCSPERNRKRHVNLLLLSHGDKRHYVCIKNMFRLVRGRSNHHDQTYLCNGCLHPCFPKQS